jgi:hypothetical protein
MIDRVAGAENRNRALKLLGDMLRRQVADFPRLKKQFFASSAVDSTYDVPGDDGMLEAVLEQHAAPVRYRPSNVPESWPENWAAGEYQFPEPYPVVPKLKDVAPKQIALDDVFRFLVP